MCHVSSSSYDMQVQLPQGLLECVGTMVRYSRRFCAIESASTHNTLLTTALPGHSSVDLLLAVYHPPLLACVPRPQPSEERTYSDSAFSRTSCRHLHPCAAQHSTAVRQPISLLLLLLYFSPLMHSHCLVPRQQAVGSAPRQHAR